MRSPHRPALGEQDETIPLERVFRQLPATTRDTLVRVDAAPQPPSILERSSSDPPSFPDQVGAQDLPRHPGGYEQVPPLEPLNGPKQSAANGRANRSHTELESRIRLAETTDCIAQREMLKGQPLSSISLDVSPQLGDGLRSFKKGAGDATDAAREIATKTMRRDWTNFRGEHLATGKLVDLRYGNVILDVSGQQRSLPLADLSDVDMTYVAEVWNLPTRCGSGYEPLAGRQFIPSTVQWKASGACYNPLYFEQVQLERYGHEAARCCSHC